MYVLQLKTIHDEGFTDIRCEPSYNQLISKHHGIMYFIFMD